MHTIVVRMSIDPARVHEAERHLREDIVYWARQQAGFVSGQWLRSADGSEGLGVVVFDSEQAASTAASGPRSYPRDEERAWNVDSVTVYGQVATAAGDARR
jgi:hypothetical protein